MKPAKSSHSRNQKSSASALAMPPPPATPQSNTPAVSTVVPQQTLGQPTSLEGLFTTEFSQKRRAQIKLANESQKAMGTELESLRHDVLTKEHMILDLQEKIKSVSDEYKKCREQKERSDLELQELREAHHVLNKQYCQLEVTYDATITAQTGELEELRKCIAQNDELEQTVATAIAQERAAQKQLQATKLRFQEVNKGFDDYQRVVNEENQAHCEAYDAIQEKLQKQIDLNKDLTAVLEENKKDLVGAQLRIEEMTTQLAGQDTLIVALKQDIERIETDTKKIIAEQAFKIREIERVCDQPARAVPPLIISGVVGNAQSGINSLPNALIMPSAMKETSALMPPPAPLKSEPSRKRAATKRRWNNQQQQQQQQQQIQQQAQQHIQHTRSSKSSKSQEKRQRRAVITGFLNETTSSSEDDSSSVGTAYSGWKPQLQPTVDEESAGGFNNLSTRDSTYVADSSECDQNTHKMQTHRCY